MSLQKKLQQQLAAAQVRSTTESVIRDETVDQDIDNEIDTKSEDFVVFKPSQTIVRSEAEDLSENAPWQPSPFRKSPQQQPQPPDQGQREYVVSEALKPSEEPDSDGSGLSITVDERTFDVFGNNLKGNMGDYMNTVKSMAKDLRGMVDGAANFMQNSVKKTFSSNKKPNNDNGILNLFGLLPNLGGADESGSSGYSAPQTTPSSGYGAPTPSYGVPLAPPVSVTTPSYGAPQAPVVTSAPQQSYNTNFVSTPASTQSNNGGQQGFFSNNNQPPQNPIGPSIEQLQHTNNQFGGQAQQFVGNVGSTTLGPNSFQSLAQPPPPPSSTDNPFLRPPASSAAPNFNNFVQPQLSTPANNGPFSDPIYRPKRNKFQPITTVRPGVPPPTAFKSTYPTTARPFKSTFATTTRPEYNQKVKDLQDVKLAWFAYYRKAKDFSSKYREKVDVKRFKKSLSNGKTKKKRVKKQSPTHRPTPTPRPLFNLTPRPLTYKTPRPTRSPTRRPTPTRPHPSPFSGITRLQLPFVHKRRPPTKRPTIPYFTILPGPSPKPRRPKRQRRPPALQFFASPPHHGGSIRRENSDISLEATFIDTMHAPQPDPTFEGMLTPAQPDYSYDDVAADKSYYDDYEYYNSSSNLNEVSVNIDDEDASSYVLRRRHSQPQLPQYYMYKKGTNFSP